MENGYSEFFKGHFLMAMPELADPNFSKTVTLICEHAPAGAVGIVVNRVHQFLTGKDIFDELKIEYSPGVENIPIHIGGPVHIDEIFLLHGPPFGWQGCLPVTSGLALSTTMDVLKEIAMGKGPESFIIALGCSGWASGQLENELRENAWLITSVFEEIIFQTPVSERWEEAVKKLGINPSSLSGKAGNA